MPKVLGQSGRYTSDQEMKLRRKIMVTVCVVIAILGVLLGLVLSTSIPVTWLSGWSGCVISLFGVLAIWATGKYGIRRLNELDKLKNNFTRGANGEIAVGNILAEFPNEYCVINGLSTPNGDLDHVVVGPTGVYVLDTKAWRGVVTADGKGELLLNDQATDKPYVRQFVGRMMGVREKVLTLAPGMEAHFNAVFVFTAARIEAKWGTTGKLNCITDDQLHSYIVEKDFGKKLAPVEVTRIAQAFLGLAHMDSDFTEKA